MTWTPDKRILQGFGLDAVKPISTQLAALYNLATVHGMEGMRYAVGYKVAHKAIWNSEKEKVEYADEASIGFQYLCGALKHQGGDVGSNLEKLLSDELAWANRYLPESRPGEGTGDTCKILPLSRWEILHELTTDFNGEGMKYALRMFTKPLLRHARSPCRNCPYFLRLFVEEVMARDDESSDLMRMTFQQSEFATFAHLVTKFLKGVGGAATPILEGPSIRLG